MKNKPLIMFDFDGVLIDTLGLCYDINIQTNKNLSLEEYKGFFDGNIYDANRADGSPRTRHDDFRAKYEEGAREIMVPDSLKKLTQQLAEKYQLAMVSGTYTKVIQDILVREGLTGCFSDILGGDIHKSKVVRIHMLLEKYGLKPSETVFVTDTVGDIHEGKECGVESIGVSWGFHEKDRLQKAGPLIVVDTVPVLTASIERFFAESAIQ